MKHATHNKNQDGQILILALIFMVIVTGLVGSLVGYAGVQIKGHRQSVARTQALNIAEAGIEAAIWKLNNVPGYTGETNTTYNNGTYDITITNLSGSERLIRASAYVPNQANAIGRRVVQVTATTGTINIGFNYGVQVGNGGLEMSNSSKVIGNVYANANIDGANSARIQGTAVVAGANGYIDDVDIDGDSWSHTIRNNSTVGGNARHAVLQNTTVTGNAVADSISNCTITGNAKYDTRSSCSVSGTATTPNPDNFVPADILPLPISEAQIDIMETEAAAGGTIGSQTFSSGTRNMGPVKIDGNLTLSGTAELVMTGSIWVTGEIKLSNSAILRLDSSYGSLDGIVIAGIDEDANNGYIEISNSAQVMGSGTEGSYVLLLSQREGTGSTAIKQDNGQGSAILDTILYAGEGMIDIANSSGMREITAAKLKISNSATVTYESGVASANFSSGPTGGFEIADQTWQLLQ